MDLREPRVYFAILEAIATGRVRQGEARLSALAPLRDDILNGDYRAPYLAWLSVKLRDLAVFQDRLPEFETRLAALQAQYANRPAF